MDSCDYYSMSSMVVSMIMTSSNGNGFRITGPLWGETTDHKRSVTRALILPLMLVSTNGQINRRVAGDLRRQHAHCDVTAMVILKYRWHCLAPCHNKAQHSTNCAHKLPRAYFTWSSFFNKACRLPAIAGFTILVHSHLCQITTYYSGSRKWNFRDHPMSYSDLIKDRSPVK